jgi:glutathione S-transferase
MLTASAPRLRLHGYAVSNYYNIARAALLEKGAAFAIVDARASSAPEFLAVSPMGKIPVLETPQGWLAETVAILDYLEDTVAGPHLHPADPFQRARGRQIINLVQLYVEGQIRSLFPGVFFGGENSPTTITAAVQMLDRACGALPRLISHTTPYLLGAELSYADLFAFYCLDIADRVMTFLFARSLLDELNLGAWFARMAERPSSRIVLADFERDFAVYLIEKNAAYRPPGERPHPGTDRGHPQHA